MSAQRWQRMIGVIWLSVALFGPNKLNKPVGLMFSVFPFQSVVCSRHCKLSRRIRRTVWAYWSKNLPPTYFRWMRIYFVRAFTLQKRELNHGYKYGIEHVVHRYKTYSHQPRMSYNVRYAAGILKAYPEYTWCLRFNAKQKNEISDRQRGSKTKMWNEHGV